MYLKKVPVQFSYLFKELYFNVKNSDKIYLSFDDGPHPESTPYLLELLTNYNIKATFFCLGVNIVKYPKLLDEILKRGHQVGYHGFNHWSGWKLKTEKYIENAKHNDAIIKTDLFRPPYGKLTIQQYIQLKKNYRIVMWSHMPGDFDDSITTKDIYNSSQKLISDGSIIVLHDSPKSLIKAKTYIKGLYETDNYRFDKLSSVIFKK